MAESPPRVRWGIVGAGRIARQFASDMRAVANGTLAAVASRSADNAAAFAAEYGIPRHHASYRALCEDPEVDAVYVATPHSLHLAHAGDALRAGKAVLCEKPLTVSVAETEALLGIARRADAFLMEAMWTWFLPAIRTALDWYRAGRIGALRHIKADFGYPLLPYDAGRREYAAELGGGALLEMGIYPVALDWLFTAREPLDIVAVGRRAPNGVEDDVSALLRYDAQTSALATSFRCKLQNQACIVGDEGYIAIPDFWRARECRLYRRDRLVDRFRDRRESLGFCFETESAGEDILAGRRESAVVTHADSLRFQQRIAAIKSAIE